jgi:Kef-type K+ transport system membrane component KefB
MSRVTALVLIVGGMAGALVLIEADPGVPGARSTMTFGFLLLAAHLLGGLLSRIRLPRITGYILAGILFGPHVLALLETSTVGELKLIDDLALTFIALAAGGELRLKDLRSRRRSILLTVFLLTGIVMLGVAAVAIVARPLLPFLDGRPFVELVVVAAILGTFAVARSPSSAIAIISETRSRGPFTETVLGVTVVMDVLVIVLFAGVVSVGQAVVSGSSLDSVFLLLVLGEVVGSLVAGIVLSKLIALYIERVRAELTLFVLGVAFLVTFGSRQLAAFLDARYAFHFHLEPMLVCMTAGFVVQNFSRVGEELMTKIDRSSLPIFVIFFALTGAALDIGALRHMWKLALIVIVARAGLIWVGAYLGALWSGDPPVFRRFAGPSYLTQAGVSLGLAGIVMARFPGWGADLATAIVAVIAVNQVVGPVAFKLSLGAVGEAGAGRRAKD